VTDHEKAVYTDTNSLRSLNRRMFITNKQTNKQTGVIVPVGKAVF